MSRLGAGLVLLVALTAAGCGSQKLDVAEVETTIGKRLARNTKEKVAVNCPDDVKIKKGDSFGCTAKTSKGKVTVKVTQLDDAGRVRGQVKAP